MKKFTKNDNSFTCAACGADVPTLKSSSRDHCNKCLSSLHVDIFPGDRANDCRGIMRPIGIVNAKKGTQIRYVCEKCGENHNCIVAPDDDFETILKLSAQG
ncbi:MAG: RNHCP domain-containing protein [Christensenellaceae bacterium]|jgi:DNA-directed RNA polymerase subunit RPC12/RpoP|nr:RNHCP domain-containing protein [Christensenellaceae bacterium]